jgi:hypothetical protein
MSWRKGSVEKKGFEGSSKECLGDERRLGRVMLRQ